MQATQVKLQLRSSRCVKSSRLAPLRAAQTSVIAPAKVVVKEHAAYTVRGTTRKQNEDRWDVKLTNEAQKAGEVYAYASVFDGHGGNAAAEYLKQNLFAGLLADWDASAPEESLEDAFKAIDEKLMRPGGFMGLGERGVGGSKCGSTSASILLYPAADGTTKVLAANVGDSRVLLVRQGRCLELYEEHVPDSEEERIRIEARNPNPKDPMVKYINGTWRVGNNWGYLALSRAFGDAFLKAGYTKGRGLVAEPFTLTDSLTNEDSWVIVSSDGLHSEESRGGGGGLDNQEIADYLLANGEKSCQELAEDLVGAAVAKGSTDDVTVVLLRLQPQ